MRTQNYWLALALVLAASACSKNSNPSTTPATVTVTTTGPGIVTSFPTGIDCGTTCTQTYKTGDNVALFATPNANATFTGWSVSGCSGDVCGLTLTADVAVTATFTPISPPGDVTLTVAVVGAGTVTSFPSGINCGATCNDSVHPGTEISLLATPSSGSVLSSWSVTTCTTDQCGLTLTANQTVTATFTTITETPATVSVTISGNGSVTSFPAGIDCGATCSKAFLVGDSISLLATAANGAVFTGWSASSCTSSVECGLALTGDVAITANFSAQTAQTATLTVVNAGGGTVTSFPAGISCGATCAMTFPIGSAVSLGALAGGENIFLGYSGGGCGADDLCGVTLNADTTVTASFGPAPTLTINLAGLGQGSVIGAGIYCFNNGGLCQTTFTPNQPIELTATANSGYFFAGWRGADCTGSTCTVSGNSNLQITAGFSGVYSWVYSGENNPNQVTSLTSGVQQQIESIGTADQIPNYLFSTTPDGMQFGYVGIDGAVLILDYWTNSIITVGSATAGFPPPNWSNSLSPDGLSVAYLGGGNLTIGHRDGSTPTVVDAFSSRDACDDSVCFLKPSSWSADGQSIAWTSTTAIASDADATVYTNVWYMHLGSAPQRLTNFNSTTITGDPTIYGPDWSPDGSRIAYASYEPLPVTAETTPSGNPFITNIWTVDLTGARTPVTSFGTEYTVDSPLWQSAAASASKERASSPPVYQIVFAAFLSPVSMGGTRGSVTRDDTFVPGGAATSTRNLFAIASDGTGLRPLTTASAPNGFSAAAYWAPDGTTLLYESTISPTDPTQLNTPNGQYNPYIWWTTLDAAAVPAAVSQSVNEWGQSPLDDDD